MTKTWFITGAAAGLGYQLTSLLLARGERVAATSRNSEPLKTLADEHGDRLWTAALDVTDTPSIRRVVDSAAARFGRLDVVVSNAGFGVLGAAEEVSDELFRRQLDVNLVGSIQLARAVLPHLRAQGGGRIVQLSSSGGRVGDPGMSLYNATKFGIEGFYESAAIELAPFGIEVTLVEPGGTRTGFNANLALAEPIPAYENGILGQLRGMLSGAADPEFLRQAVPGDPVKIAAAIIDSVAISPAPRRIVLGSGAYAAIGATLRDQLEALRAQHDLAHSTDSDDVVSSRA
ncbi:MAG: short-chain dehydrogenase/reductase [Amycolatopsis sp.]|jgi:NAD(P)-dependent dehydrogenase (short-subunit alcohol dehydrogenase family)|uniref:SDR family oxidoreductase n=1 Tax=Amycolatopsis sp. TaxID=37632 RepID=UPI002629D60F|nr:SDR family oxidoreductase [Amycolatopsis sp.]MCU1684193.1 short-chain dehydrogenase/reductase [Amycolatopsis sp.]